jgi:hypothetical protein
MQGMKSLAVTLRHAPPRDWALLLAASAAALVLSSLDQCTRGPSITAMLLTNLNRIC